MARQPKDNEQFLVRLKTKLVEKLREHAEEFGYDSGNQVAAEIIERYFEFWLQTKSAEFESLNNQRSQLLGKAPAPVPIPQQVRKQK